ncbi:MAG: hypothetical protein V4722_14845 [Bacteroidota bacterium]
MKTILTLLFLLAMVLVNGQRLGDISSYLNNPRVIKDAKDYYRGKFRASDDTRTFNICDKINAKKSDTLLPFYLLCFSKILVKADGALSEAACDYTYEASLNNTIYLGRFFLENPQVKKLYLNEWLKSVADGIQFNSDFASYKKEIKLNIKNATAEIQKFWNDFMIRVGKIILSTIPPSPAPCPATHLTAALLFR